MYPAGPAIIGNSAARDFDGQVAQLVEHVTENHGVAGSIPALATKFLRYPVSRLYPVRAPPFLLPFQRASSDSTNVSIIHGAPMATESTTNPPTILLVEPLHPKHEHADLLTRAGFRVERLSPADLDGPRIRDIRPAIVAIELDGARTDDALDIASRLRVSPSRRAVPLPVIVYGHGLSAADIERAARSGAMWLQLEPSDGTKLVAAIRGVLTAGGILFKDT
jgi:hypothetical protein